MSQPGLVMDPRELNMSAASLTLAKNVAETLNKHYPGHLWGVNVDDRGGIVSVYNLALSGRWGFIIKITDLAGADDMVKVMRAGGEILERYRLSRGAQREGDLNEVKRDIYGNKVFDK